MEEDKSCTTVGCTEQYYEEKQTAPIDMCRNCGTSLGDGQAFCPKCGTPKDEKKKRVCDKCGAELNEEQIFCTKCGNKVDLQRSRGIKSAVSRLKSTIVKNKKDYKEGKILVIVLAAIVAAIVLCVLCFGNNINKQAFAGVKIGMKRTTIESKFSNSKKYKMRKSNNNIDVEAINKDELTSFGYPIDYISVGFDYDSKVKTASVYINLNTATDIKQVEEDFCELLSNTGSCIYRETKAKYSEYVYTIKGTSTYAFMYICKKYDSQYTILQLCNTDILDSYGVSY